MIYNNEFFELADQIDHVAQTIKSSDTFAAYTATQQNMYQDDQVQVLIQSFVVEKQAFEQIEAYGAFAPGFKERRRKMRLAKRELVMNDRVSEYRVAETNLQRLLDEITVSIATCFSASIKVDAGSPFFHSKSSCGGNCHA
ncbi:hypothetical protein A5886_001371 [Enterococcus sp. 8G7_MSG3316]|uniref:YlbF family regulator n=1 Tax=Candidatus Enterococcus testudinis TaxID=1834191 RepID=A0A242A5J2_9ENTE|nr:YlbF family regulator [Enterococcus sp. 8G7_MSG3316]OTN76294.1 hypothetical protein A5886_001371 [Enterococcus sp. 8G7_MSG3316]